jgi:hypothetical protein
VGVVEIDGRRLVLSNLDKVLWPELGMTKGQMLDYYARVATTLLPHLRGRPVTLRRFPDGVDGVTWHQNECRGEPGWLTVHETSGRGGRRLRFCVLDDLASLMWVVNQAAIEIHPFLWNVTASRKPLEVVFDLDPGPPAGLVDCAGVALRLRELLAELGLESFRKRPARSACMSTSRSARRRKGRRRRRSRGSSPASSRASARTRSSRRCARPSGPARSTSTGCRTTPRGRPWRRIHSGASPCPRLRRR